MRTVIEHRGKDIRTGEWRYGFLDLMRGVFSIHERGMYYSRTVDPDTVSAQTGLQDNSEERRPIYYGDIVNGHNIYPTLPSENRYFTGIVVQSDSGPGIRIKGGFGVRTDWSHIWVQVVGNQWDNPDLMKLK